MRYSVLGAGKRLRAYLVFACAEMYSVNKVSSYRVGSAVEMAHSFSLVHDDLPCMDDDDLRRGKPSTHVVFGESTAILAGNSLLSTAFEILSNKQTHEVERVRLDLIKKFAQVVGPYGMCGGQLMDLSTENSFGEQQIIKLQNMKTALMISFCCEAGGILGEASSEDKNILSIFGKEIGLVFQIVDDLLDIEGKVEDVGKRVRKDQSLGKSTLISLLGVEASRKKAYSIQETAVKKLNSHFGSKARRLAEISDFILKRKI